MKLVSAVMPTRGRPEFARHALNSFLSQTYTEKELIILDDYEEPSFLEMPDIKRVVYFRSESRSISEKRNLCCSLASGDLICHFDSDDWSAPERIADQVQRIDEAKVAVTGYHSMLFYEPATQRTAKYCGHSALGTSLMYTRVWAVAHPFRPGPNNPNVGEDNGFVKTAQDMGEFISVDAGQLMVARAHEDNTSKKDMNKFHQVPASAIPAGFFL